MKKLWICNGALIVAVILSLVVLTFADRVAEPPSTSHAAEIACEGDLELALRMAQVQAEDAGNFWSLSGDVVEFNVFVQLPSIFVEL